MLRSRLIRDTLRYAPAVLIPAATSVVSVGLFTRLLGAADYGLYSVAAAAISIATIVAAEWIGQSVLRYLPLTREPSRSRQLVGDALGLASVTALVLLLAAAFVRLAIGPGGAGSLAALLIPAAALLIAEVAFSVLGAIMQARLQSRALSLFRIIGAVFRLGMAVGFVLLVARGVSALLVGSAVGRAIAVAAALPFVARGEGAWVRPRLDRRSLSRFLGYGFPMVGWALASQILGLSDRFVIGAFHGTTPVGIYSASYNLVVMGFGLLGGPLLMAAQPLIVSAWAARNRDVIVDVVTAYSRPYIVAVVPLLVLLTICSRDVVSVVVTGAFRDGSRVVPVLALGSFVWGLAMFGHKGLELMERTRLMFGLVAACALFNLGLNLVFVPRFGYVAAAWTTLASNAAYPVLVKLWTRKTIPWRIPWGTAGRALAAGLAAGGAGDAAGRLVRGDGFILHLAVVTIVTVGLYASFVALWMARHGRPAKGTA